MPAENETAEKRKTCLACGRPLTGRQRKWCSRSDCGGWEAVHPPTTIKCVSCGSTFETYVGSGYTKCNSCRYSYALRCPDAIAESDMERLVADYVRKDEAIKYLRWGKSIGPNVGHYEDGITVESSSYNPNFCENCGKVVNHGQYGNCGIYPNEGCGKKNPNAITVCYCSNCGDYTLFDGKGFCLKCNQISERYTAGDSAAEVWLQREIRYKKYTGIESDRYMPDNRTLGEEYWSFIFEQAPRIMYDFVCDGWTPDEIGEEFERNRGQVVQMVRQYAEENNLENPYPRSIPTTTELPIKQWLEDNGIAFEHQFAIPLGHTWTVVDFYIPSKSEQLGICLYCDGNYWHGDAFPKVQAKDKAQTEGLTKMGYKVIRLTETQIQDGVRPLEILEGKG